MTSVEWPALATGPAISHSWAGLPAGSAVMGVLNVTPDSFSDGGRFRDAQHAIETGIAMFAEGAAIVDVGGETTRPRSSATDSRLERARAIPVVAGLARAGVRVSIDTRHAATMQAALDAGASIVNDVSALTHDPHALSVVARAGCPVVLMHMRGTPADMHEHARYYDVAGEVRAELAARIEAALQAGIDRSAIAIDPGIGFAKRGCHNIALMRGLKRLVELDRPIVVGASRKGFIGVLSKVAVAKDRTIGSIAAGLFAMSQGASMLRVHDVAATVEALGVWRGLTGEGEA